MTFLVTTLHSFFSTAFFHPFFHWIFKLACALWNARGSGQHATAMSNFGDKAATLVRDLGQSEKGTPSTIGMMGFRSLAASSISYPQLVDCR